jgi:hypothetical protein
MVSLIGMRMKLRRSRNKIFFINEKTKNLVFSFFVCIFATNIKYNSNMYTENKKITDVLELAKNFTPKEWAEFLHLSRKFRKADLPDYENPISTSTDARDLLNILVQTTIDFLKERKLDDVYEVSFSADGLYDSVAYGEWTPSTDASISFVGLQEDEDKDYRVRKLITSYM